MNKLEEQTWRSYMDSSLTSDALEDALRQGMDVNVKCFKKSIFAGDTLLHTEALFGHTDNVRTLLSYDAGVKAVNDHGETALITVSNGCLQSDVVGSVRLLLENGADPNETGKRLEKDKGKTLLMFLLYNGNQSGKRFKIIKDLLEFGAKVTMENKDGQNAMDIAKEKGLDELLALMEPFFQKEMKIFNNKAAVLHKKNIQKTQSHTTPKPRRRSIHKGR